MHNIKKNSSVIPDKCQDSTQNSLGLYLPNPFLFTVHNHLPTLTATK